MMARVGYILLKEFCFQLTKANQETCLNIFMVYVLVHFQKPQLLIDWFCLKVPKILSIKVWFLFPDREHQLFFNSLSQCTLLHIPQENEN